MLVVGDSIAWGQGLNDAQKMHVLTANSLAAATGVQPQIFHRAASGATIGDAGADPGPSEKVESWWPRELPEGNPTVYQQCHQVEADYPDQIFDIILLSGGINDVSVDTIFNPLVEPKQIQGLSLTYCHGAMGSLLDRVRTTFVARNPQARVLVLGYYGILSPLSHIPDIGQLLKAIARQAFAAGSMTAALALGNTEEDIDRALKRNASAFRDASRTDLMKAVAEANAKGPSGAFTFVDPAFTDEDAAFTLHPLIWGFGKDFTAEDPRAAARQGFCKDVGKTSELERFPCEHASLGHPNVAGAQKYAQAILAALR